MSPTNISNDEGAFFNTTIPSIDENADIQTAFRLYHYGEGNAGTLPLNEDSIAGYLQVLSSEKLSGVPGQLLNGQDLNNYTTSGFFVQESDANARSETSKNYPTFPPEGGDEYAGLLRVIAGTGVIFQEYHMSGLRDRNFSYWRSQVGGIWSLWQSFANFYHNHDERYVQSGEVDTLFVNQIKYKTVRVPTINANAYTLTKTDEDSIIIMDSQTSFPNTLFIPQDVPDPSSNITVGTSIRVIQGNNGKITFSPAVPDVVELRATPGNVTRDRWSLVTLTKLGTNIWILSGDLDDVKTNTQRKAVVGIYVQPTEPSSPQDGDLWFW
jgi:hypothetical protein